MASPGGRDRATRPPPRARLSHPPRVTEVERAGPAPPHGLSVISGASARTGDPAVARRPARPSVARGGAQRPARALAEAGPGEGAGRSAPAPDAPSAPRARDPRAAPPPPPAPRPGSAGRREGAGSGHGGRRRRTPTALPSRHAPPRPQPTCAPAPAGAWPGAAHPDAAAAAAGLARSPPLRRTERPARRGGAQRSPRNPFVWLKRRDVTRRPNRRLARGGASVPGGWVAATPAGHSAVLRTLGTERLRDLKTVKYCGPPSGGEERKLGDVL